MNFYDGLNKLISSATKKISIYSVSACFGFYSKGMHTFEDFAHALKEKLKNKNIKCIIILKVEDFLDAYGIYCLTKYFENIQNIEIVFSPVKYDNGENRIMEEYDFVQYVIVDDSRVLVTTKQTQEINYFYDLTLNKLTESKYEKKVGKINLIKEHFQEKYKDSEPFPKQIDKIIKKYKKNISKTVTNSQNETKIKPQFGNIFNELWKIILTVILKEVIGKKL
jgi:hypothetical protein